MNNINYFDRPIFALKCTAPNEAFSNYFFKETWGQNNKVLTRSRNNAFVSDWRTVEQLQYQLNLEKGYHWLMIVSTISNPIWYAR